VDGIIVINKPYGATSHQVVQSVRRLFQGIKAGHSGTLDPAATGVLPVCLGKATRIAEYIIEHPKTYRAAVTLGITTDTEDAAGRKTGQFAVPGIDQVQIEQILSGFIGNIEQLPPLYSAVKYRGKPLYHWTRSGKDVPRRVRLADIYSIELLEFNDDREAQIIFDVQCSKGTYIRTLAADIGRAVGCGAHLFSLTRLAVGPFKLEKSLTLEKVAELARSNCYEEFLLPMDTALVHFPKLKLEDKHIKALKNGQTVCLDHLGLSGQFRVNDKIRIYDTRNNFKAIACWEQSATGNRLKTSKYLSDG